MSPDFWVFKGTSTYCIIIVVIQIFLSLYVSISNFIFHEAYVDNDYTTSTGRLMLWYKFTDNPSIVDSFLINWHVNCVNIKFHYHLSVSLNEKESTVPRNDKNTNSSMPFNHSEYKFWTETVTIFTALIISLSLSFNSESCDTAELDRKFSQTPWPGPDTPQSLFKVVHSPTRENFQQKNTQA